MRSARAWRYAYRQWWLRRSSSRLACEIAGQAHHWRAHSADAWTARASRMGARHRSEWRAVECLEWQADTASARAKAVRAFLLLRRERGRSLRPPLLHG